MIKHLLFFLFILTGTTLYGAEEIALEEGGQTVEKITVEKPTEEQAKDSIPPLKIQEQESDKELLRNAQASDVVGSRPPPQELPTNVKIAVFIRDIALIDDAEQTFTANITLVSRWVDTRLADSTSKTRELPLNSVWNPLLRIANERSLTSKNEESVFVQSEGHVLYAQNYIGTFTVPLDLKDFPLDKHKLYIRIRSFFSPDEVKFAIDENLTGWEDKLSIPDWIVTNGQAKIETVHSKFANRDQSQFEFSFEIERLIGFYLWKIMLPLSLIVFISWGVFWIDPKRLEAQIGLSATTFLTLFAFQFAIAALLPRIAYLTRMDRYTMLCSLLVFSTIIMAIITSYFAKKEKEKTALYIDYGARILFPLAFIGILIYSFVL